MSEVFAEPSQIIPVLFLMFSSYSRQLHLVARIQNFPRQSWRLQKRMFAMALSMLAVSILSESKYGIPEVAWSAQTVLCGIFPIDPESACSLTAVKLKPN